MRRRLGLGIAAVALAGAAAFAAARRPAALGDRGRCAAYDGLPAGWGLDARAGMVRIAGGTITLGSKKGYPEERPGGPPVQVAPFWIDRTEVTNAQFAAFVAATGHVTDAERAGGAAVFTPPPPGRAPERAYDWWRFVPGASWRHPEGPGSDLEGRAAHPVVQVTAADARAYARWLGRALPTEAEWELAARAGRDAAALDRAPVDAAGRPLANVWQGPFPEGNSAADGFAGRAPVGCYPPDGAGLHDLVGNVWEWTGDVYGPHGAPRACHPAPGGEVAGAPVALVIKGGSFLCAPESCARYRAAARHAQEAGLPTSHLGFRTVKRP